MNRKIIIALVCTAMLFVSAFLACQNQNSKDNDKVVKIGRTVYGKSDVDAFNKLVSKYPEPPPSYYPARPQTVSFMAEIEAIYQYISKDRAKFTALHDSVTKSRDWEWKKIYYTASLFVDLMRINLGFTDSELEAYYKKTSESFKTSIKTDDGSDSSFIPTFETVKRQVADNLFCEKYKPDSAFLSKLSGDERDSVSVRNLWLYNVRSGSMDFYMRQFFLERNGEVYRDDIDQIYGGDDKLIVSDDIDVIRSWTSQSMRMEALIEWLYKWKVFSEHVEKNGIASAAEIKKIHAQILRIELAKAYLKGVVLPSQKREVTDADITLAEFLSFDRSKRVGTPSRQEVQTELNDIGLLRNMTAVDSAIYGIRKRIGVTFFSDDPKLRDERDSNPTVLIAKADSLKEAAVDMSDSDGAVALAAAESLYRTVATDFAFTADGRRAMGEFAMMLVDRYSSVSNSGQDRLLNQAVQFYRRSQVFEADPDNLCNSYFMIGLIYDDHLKNYDLAEANYKWILRNAPKCALASDVEFMILHLGEPPMTSIEEIRGQSMRQGRVVEFNDDIDDDDDPAS